MNIYKTTTLGVQEITTSLEIDSEKQTDVDLAMELLGVEPKKPSVTGIFVEGLNLDNINSVDDLLNAMKDKKILGVSKGCCI